jgi:hypothetical protein
LAQPPQVDLDQVDLPQVDSDLMDLLIQVSQAQVDSVAQVDNNLVVQVDSVLKDLLAQPPQVDNNLVPQVDSVDSEVQVILVPQVASAQVSVLKDQVGTDLELRL